MINKKIFILLVFVLSVFSVYSHVSSATNSVQGYIGRFDCPGCSTSRSNARQVPNNFQAHRIEISGTYDGHGDLGRSGGKYAVSACLNDNGMMWYGACWNFIQSGSSGNVGGNSGNFNVGDNIGADSNNFTYGVVEYYVNDAELNPTMTVYGRKVSITGINTTNSTVAIGQDFDITWDVRESKPDSTELSWTGPVNCDVGPSPQSVADNGYWAGTTCRATAAGTATFTIDTVGYSGSGDLADSDSVSVNINPSFAALDFIVKNQNGTNISGATVTINQDFGNGTTRITDGSGFANFGVNKNVTVGWGVTATDCSPVSNSQVVGNSNVTVNVTMNCTSSGGNPPPVPQPAVGNIEVANCNVISGVAADPDDQNASVIVALFKDYNAYGTPDGSPPVGSPPYGEYLPPYILADTLVTRTNPPWPYVVNNKPYGFSFAVPDSLKDGLNHPIYIHAVDLNGTGPNNAIAGSGTVVLNCPPNTPSTPTLNTVSIAPVVVPNGINEYTVTIAGSDTGTGGGNKIKYQLGIINYQGTSSNVPKGYFGWGEAPSWAGYKSYQACTGGGFAAVQPTLGERYISIKPGSCVTSVPSGGNTRTTTFILKFDPAFTSPLTDNDISGFVQNSDGNNTGFVNVDTNFALNFSSCSAFGTTNVAQGRPVTALVAENPPWNVGPASNLTDGNTGSQAYNGTTGLYYSVNLGGLQPVRQIKTYLAGYGHNSPNVYVTSWNIDGKNSSGTWIPLAVGVGPESDYVYAYPSFDISEIRFKADSTTNWIGAYELEAYACASLDLTAGGVTPIAATAGTPLAFTSTITNGGSVSTVSSFNNLFQVSAAANGSGGISTISVNSRAALVGGASGPVTSLSYTFPSSGTYSVRACADSNASMVGAIAESNEANNCSGWTNITVAPAAVAPTLSASPITGNVVGVGTLRADFQNIPTPGSLDWIAVYPVGSPDQPTPTTNPPLYTDWVWASDCTRTLPTTAAPGRPNGFCSNLAMPTSAGNYEIRMFSNNGWNGWPTKLTSNPVSVQAPVGNVALTVTANPGPGGKVSTADNLINCGSDCSENYPSGSNVVLNAVPASSYWKFNGWTTVPAGRCVVSGNTCAINNLTSPVTANAAFIPRSFIYKEF
ncbi:MAG: putative cell-wall-anchored protein SasA [Parcubacteria bacterium C7867-003]|nr:MAG: putative cell-wall-anchored protein SasA [Parcubacteria bacterium C7867-003]